MKTKVFVLLVLLLSSCVSHRAMDALDRTEEMLSESPDSALAIVRAIQQEDLTTRSLRARHALLLTQAQDMSYVDVKEDSTILVAYNWYKHGGNRLNRLKSTYYLGVIRQNAGNDIEAAILFRAAEPLAEELKEYRWKSLCSQHLSQIYSSNFDQGSALQFAKESLNAAEKAGDTLMAGYCRLDVASRYLALSQLDSAEVLLKQVIRDSDKRRYLHSYASRLLAKRYLFEKKPDYDKADSLYHAIVEEGAIPLTSQDYGDLGLIAEYKGMQQLSRDFCKKAEETMLSMSDSSIYFLALTNIYDIRNDCQQAYDSYSRAMEIQNRIVSVQLEQSISHAMENYYEGQAELEKEKKRVILLLFVLLGSVLVGLIVWLVRRLRKSRQEVLENMAQIQDFSKDLDVLQSRDKDSQVLLDYYTKEMIGSLNSLATAYFSWDSENVRQKEKRIGGRSKEEMIKVFQKQLEGFRKDKTFYSSLEKSLNVSDNNIMDRARETLKQEKKYDFELLLLYFAGFSAKSICFLKGLTEASVRMRKTRLKQFFAALPDCQGRDFVKKLEHGE